MIHRVTCLLSSARLAPITGLTVLSIVSAPQSRAQPQAAVLPQFEVASIRPSKLAAGGDSNRESIDTSPGGRVTLRSIPLRSCLMWAYGVQDPQISGPDWLASERYDIVAQAGGPAPEDQLKLMLRSLLADRFKVALHRERKEVTLYALLAMKNGPKFKASEGDGKSNIRPTAVGVFAEKISMPEFADLLSRQLRSPVTDMTGLKGRYDLAFDLRQYVVNQSTPVGIASLLLEAMEDQLGLKLQSQKAPAEVLVIDHVEQPTEN